jgi:hypothetical protein
MVSNQNKLIRTSVEQQPDNMALKRFDLELASVYAANSEWSLEIIEEFAAVDQEGF